VPIAEIDISSGVVRIFSGIDRHALHEILATLNEVRR
jgi:putative methionine-R-sulfoxide reductase with GAF domain